LKGEVYHLWRIYLCGLDFVKRLQNHLLGNASQLRK
jgi:hypothetical protein